MGKYLEWGRDLLKTGCADDLKEMVEMWFPLPADQALFWSRLSPSSDNSPTSERPADPDPEPGRWNGEGLPPRDTPGKPIGRAAVGTLEYYWEMWGYGRTRLGVVNALVFNLRRPSAEVQDLFEDIMIAFGELSPAEQDAYFALRR